MNGVIDKAGMWTERVHMRTVTVRDLRNNFSKVETWLGEGEEIRIEKRGKPIGFLSAKPRSGNAVPKVDFAARLDAIWGDRVFSEEEVREMRDAELEGEEG
jgi:antitoxin (DNA-binding transcriptional repressor) of toxin-antitoxin stability system